MHNIIALEVVMTSHLPQDVLPIYTTTTELLLSPSTAFSLGAPMFVLEYRHATM